MSSRKQAFSNPAEEEVDDTILEDGEEDEEFDEDEFPLDFEDDEEDETNEEILSAFLTTEDGDNIATVLHNTLEGINKAMNVQNQILVKILTQLSKNNSN